MEGVGVMVTCATVGAGLVTVASLKSVCDAVATHVPEALLMPLPSQSDALEPGSMDAHLLELPVYDSVVVGPGLSRSVGVQGFLAEMWKRAPALPTLIDADALNCVADGVLLPAGPDCILTPHPGEASRLLKVVDVQSDRFGSARKLAEKTGKTILLKGAYTVIAQTGQPLLVNPTGNPGMAAPGMGDVLSGVIGALLAKGMSPVDAASAGAYWHGMAGDICAADIGPAGFLASEVADALPRARATIASSCQEA